MSESIQFFKDQLALKKAALETLSREAAKDTAEYRARKMMLQSEIASLAETIALDGVPQT